MPESAQPLIGPYESPPAVCRDYDHRTANVARLVAATIRDHLPQVQVEHVGSTSVPGCAGKGIVDLMIPLTMRKEKLPPEVEKQGYKDYTSAALHTKARTAYGYFEVKAKPMDSAGSSSFWFTREGVPGWWTEIDVFEIGGKAKGFEQKYNMNLHVFQTPQEKNHWDVQHTWIAPWRLADAYHVYGLEWDKDEIKYFVDGVLVRSVENTHWHQPLSLIFDSETMPDWFGMPKDEDLPSTFSVEYVRAWKTKS